MWHKAWKTTRIVRDALDARSCWSIMVVLLTFSSAFAQVESQHENHHQWYFDMAANLNLPTGTTNYPVVFDPNWTWNPYSTPVSGGFSLNPNLTYAFKAGYGHTISNNGKHSILAGLWLNKFQGDIKFEDYSFVFQGNPLSQTYKAITDVSYQYGVSIGYQLKLNRVSFEISALRIIREDTKEYAKYTDGYESTHKIPSTSYKFHNLLPSVQANYNFFDLRKIQLSVFTAAVKHQVFDNSSTKWWNLQAGIRVGL